MRNRKARKLFLSQLSVRDIFLSMAEQVHGTSITILESLDVVTDTKAVGSDGIVSKAIMKNDTHHVLGVRVADCVPIIAVDPEARVIGVAHAGWKGTIGGISGTLLKSMKKVGAKMDRVLVWVGPHIEKCCYSVSYDRALRFVQAFHGNPTIASKIGATWHVDIGNANVIQLTNMGVRPDNIDMLSACTRCQADDFFSYRRDSKNSFGEMLGVVGFRE
ncbi:polyphenol oxidase family protein [Candidatus Gottesmanbacteria bacterium]|nr:polyphenol oxidase family protein [Candidatus Gottesmanbacteria bacterium]